MNLSWDLEEMFPTEHQKYAAMKKFIIIYICLILLNLISYCFFDISFFSIPLIAIFLVGIYVNLYIFYKSKILIMLLKLIAGLVLSLMISLFISILLAGDESIKLIFTVPFIGLVSLAVASVVNRKRWNYVKRNFRYVSLIVISGAINLSFKIILCLKYGRMLEINDVIILGNFFGNLLFAAIVVYFYTLEEKRGVKFYDVSYMMMAVPLTLMFLLFSWISIFMGHFFQDNVFLNDGNVDLAGTDFNNVDLPDADIAVDNHFTDIQDTDFSGVSDYSGVVFPSGFEIPAITGLGAFSAGNTLDFGGATINTTIDIPEFHSNPYMLFTTHSNVGNFNIADANGMTQISVVDGNVYDATHTLVGGLKHDDVTGITTLNSNSNEVVMSWDQQNNIYAGTPETGHLVGRVDKGVGANTLRDMSGGIVSYTDALGNAYGANGTPLGSVRKI